MYWDTNIEIKDHKVRWSKHEKNLFKRNNDKTAREIADILNVSGYDRTVKAVESYRHKTGVLKYKKKKKKGVVLNGKDLKQLSSLLEKADKFLVKLLKKSN